MNSSRSPAVASPHPATGAPPPARMRGPASTGRHSLDGWLALVFVACTLLFGATLWYELVALPIDPPQARSA